MADFLTCLLGVGIAALAYNIAMAEVIRAYRIKRHLRAIISKKWSDSSS